MSHHAHEEEQDKKKVGSAAGWWDTVCQNIGVSESPVLMSWVSYEHIFAVKNKLFTYDKHNIDLRVCIWICRNILRINMQMMSLIVTGCIWQFNVK